MIVHSEFHRLIDEVEDAHLRMSGFRPIAERRQYLDAYEAWQQRKRELYEWVTAHTPTPEALYAIRVHF